MKKPIQKTPILSLVFLLMIILGLPDDSIGEPGARTIQYICGHQIVHNMTIFVPNFVATMENISDQLRDSYNYGAAISGRGPDTNYGLAQCYGKNPSLFDCALCYAEARTLLSQCFPFTGGRIFLNGCFMRSENYNFFQEFRGPQDRAVCGNRTREDSLFYEFARRAILEAASNAPLNGAGHGGTAQAIPTGYRSAYALAECWDSLNTSSCKACLENASASILRCLPWSEGWALNTGCFMRYSDINFLDVIPVSDSLRDRSFSSSSSVSRFPMAKPGCRDTCGNNVMIPYPFGIGSNCGFNGSYTINCKSTNSTESDIQVPFLKVKGNEYEVLQVSLRDQTVTINDPPRNTSCSMNGFEDDTTTSGFNTYSSINLEGTPYFYSKDNNRLTLLGCGNARLYENRAIGRNESVLSTCTSTFLPNSSNTSSCFHMNCCKTDIPFNLKQYWVNFTAEKTSKCATAILADKKWEPDYNPYVPVVLSWTLRNPNETVKFLDCNRISSSIQLQNGNISVYGCECKNLGSLTWLYEVNPYLNGTCVYAYSVINGNSEITEIAGRKNTKVVTIGAPSGFGMLLLIIAFFTLYKMLKKCHKKKRKEKFFKQNGGLLLQQQLSTDEGVVDKTKIFSAQELKKASDGFSVSRVLGEGGQATIYKGMLTDGRIVAIKKSKKVGKNQLQGFINEVVILSQVNHRNVVKLLGCCLETEVPLLVYEFIPNGTLFNHIHTHNDEEFTLTWSTRLRIGIEVASALAYLHSSISIPIFHKDIKSSNILLDGKHVAKVADFGISRSVAVDKTHLTTCVQGTFGYIDPEYFQSSRFTDKSDVYSYGVVLIELLTRQKPISAEQGEENYDLGLAARFSECMEKNSLKTILDPQILHEKNEEDQVIAVAKLAHRCVNLNGRRRPTMREVAMELESIKMSNLNSTLLANSPSCQSYIEEEFSDSSTFGSERILSASPTIPLLFDTN